MKLKPKKSEKSEPETGKPVSKISPNPETITMPDVKLVAIARLQDTDDWYTVFQFRRHDGCTAYMAMPSGDASHEGKVTAALRNAGTGGGNHFTFPNLVRKLTMATGPTGGLIIIRGGWDEAGKCFALPDKMLGGETAGSASPKFISLDFNWKKHSQLVVRDGSPGVSQLNISCRGSTESWQTKVAMPALKSSFMMSAICSAFAAPLLKLLGMAPFTIALTGETTSGKTTATVVGGSVIGFGGDQLPTWNITSAGLEQRAEIHFDILLPIDDLNSAPGSEKDKFKLINGVAYRITGGSVRHTLTTAKSSITGRPPIKGPIRTIIFTSAEDSMADIAATAKMNLPGGFYSRLIEIPVPKPKNGGVFDQANFEGSRSKRVKAARKLSKEIASACGKNHGYVFRKYVKAIIKNPAEATELRARDLDEQRQKDFAVWCVSQGFRLSYAARIIGVLAAAVRNAGVPAPRIFTNENVMRERWRLTDAPPERRFIPTDKELGRMLSAEMPEKLFRWIIIQMTTAGRPQTAVDLNPTMRDRDARLVHLNPPTRRQNKKYRATVRECRVLRGWLDKWEKVGLDAYGGRYCGYVTIGGVKTALRALRVRGETNLPLLSTYSFRHKVTTVLRQGNVTEDQVSLMLGHRRMNLRTTGGYGEWSPSYLADAAAAIDAWFLRVQRHCTRALFSHGIPTRKRARKSTAT